MTETPDTTGAAVPPGPKTIPCVHCGVDYVLEEGSSEDWLCPACDRYQDTMVCPTCHSVVRTSLQGGS